MDIYENAVFGNREGSHQLLSSSLPLTDSVLDTLRFLVDRPAGHIEPGVMWYPYWGCQSLGNWWVIWRGEEDRSAPRKNMVTARVVLVPIEQCVKLDDISELISSVGFSPSELGQTEGLSLAASVIDCLASDSGPAIVPNLSLAPNLLQDIWPHLWANARASLSLRTLFGVESLESVSRSSIVVIPTELRPRWHGQQLIDQNDFQNGPAARWLSGSASSHLTRLIEVNADRLPGDLRVLLQVERIVDRLERLKTGKGKLSDALVVVRTQEAFADGFLLSKENIETVAAELNNLDNASVNDVRTASLSRLETIPELGTIEKALTRWVEKLLPEQPIEDALWILEQKAGDAHAAWWRRAVKMGVSASCREKSRKWANAIWKWWQAQPKSVSLIIEHIEKSHTAEKWIAKSAPTNLNDELVDALLPVCHEREWPTLLIRALGTDRPLVDCIKQLRLNLSNPDTSLDELLIDRSAVEIIDAAADTVWPPLMDKAVSYTLTNPQLLESALKSDGLVPLLLRHLSLGGVFPVELGREDFLLEIFENALKGKDDALIIVKHLDRSSGRLVIDYPECDRLMSTVSSECIEGAVEEWWRRFLEDGEVGKPPLGLCSYVLKSVRRHIDMAPIMLVISLLRLFPEITETEFEDWMKDIGFLWEEGDHQRLAYLLTERQWRAAARTLRWSWKRELRIVAWYARELFPWYEPFVIPPIGVEKTISTSNSNIRGGMNRIDVGIITMKEEEYEALLDKFSPTNTVEGGNRDYDVAAISTDRGECRVAITRCIQQGNAHAQSTATELLNDLKPSFVIIVGIAGAVPTSDFCLGDVVVSNYIQDLTLEDTGSTSRKRRFNALGGPLHSSATRIVERLRAVERESGPWNEAETIGVPRPELDGEYTTDNEQWNKKISAALRRIKDRNSPIATAQKIASSDRLIKDPELLKEWRNVLKAVAAVEMESAGVYIPCQRNNVPVLAIRGISDIVGWKRDDAWTLYACHTAASYTRMLVSTGVFCPKS